MNIFFKKKDIFLQNKNNKFFIKYLCTLIFFIKMITIKNLLLSSFIGTRLQKCIQFLDSKKMRFVYQVQSLIGISWKLIILRRESKLINRM